MNAWRLGLLLSLLAGLSLAVDTTTERSNITYPPYGSRFNIKDTVIVSWTSNYTEDQAQIMVWTVSGDNTFAPVWTQNLTGNSLPNGSYAIDLNTIDFSQTEATGSTWDNFVNVWQNSSAEHDSGNLPDVRVDFVIFEDSSAPAQTWSAQPVPTASLPASVTGSHAKSTGNSGDSGLSTGAKAGIGIGVAVAVLAVLGLVGGLLFMRRRRRAPNPITEQSPGSTAAWPHEKSTPGTMTPFYSPAPSYPPGTEPVPPQQQYAYEMIGSQPQNEMDAGSETSLHVLHEMGTETEVEPR